MNLKNLLKLILVFGLLISVVPELKAQKLLNEIPVMITQGTWNSISGVEVARRSDDGQTTVNLPFPFEYDGYVYTQGRICANGWFGFNPMNGTGGLTPWNIYDHRPAVQPMARDGYLDGNCELLVEGATPNRVAIYQYNDFNYYYSDRSSSCYYQVRLYETSNKVEIVYGPMSRGTSNVPSGRQAMVGFSSRVTTQRYYNLQPSMDGSPDGWVVHSPTEMPITTKLLTQNAQFDNIPEGLTITLGASEPKLVSAVPANETAWPVGDVFPETDSIPAVYYIREASHPAVNFNMTIFRKEDPDDIIYRAYVQNFTGTSPDEETAARCFMDHASEIAAGANNCLDLRAQGIIPGDYVVKATMTMADDPAFYQEVVNRIILPVQHDLEVYDIYSPKLKTEKIYAIDGMDIQVRVRNKGAMDRESWKLTTDIYDENYELVAEYEFNYPEDDIELGGDGHKIITNEIYKVDFGKFVADNVGEYYIKAEVTYEGGTDQYNQNNTFPRAGDDEWSYVALIARSIDLRAVDMVYPEEDEEVIVGRPIKPECSFSNFGNNDASLNDITINILHEGDTVFTDVLENEPISSLDTTVVKFLGDFIPEETGEYTACFEIASSEDNDPSYKKKCQSFVVIGALEGEYTIGNEEEYLNNGEINPRNFLTIDDAVDALYHLGITAPVEFVFTDNYYELGHLDDIKSPALDLTSRIAGVDADNTITFRASDDLAMERADHENNRGVTIKLNAGNGKGIVIGQSGLPTNDHAIAYPNPDKKLRVADDLLPYYAQSAGYFIFDGGENKSLLFLIETPIETNESRYFQAPFYFIGGASNNTITNCLFESTLEEDPHALIPRTRRNSSTQEYEDELGTQGTSFSAAIVMRTKVPVYENSMNSLNFDTLTCDNNIISNNEISGFGYGIVSLGTGAILQSGSAKYKRFYNKSNTYDNNKIHDVSRAGIFLGNEEYSTIKNNKIYNVKGTYLYFNVPDNRLVADAAGILLGGEETNNWNGYNNIAITIENNEIGAIEYNGHTAVGTAAGIYCNQVQTLMPLPASGHQKYPDEDEKFMIRNNIIWGINGISSEHNRYGIVLLADGEDGYQSRKDVVVNNTIMIEDDGKNSNGQIIGVGFQKSYEPVLKNNAISITDATISDISSINALVFYEGVMPGTQGGLVSNRNAFWTSFKNDPSDRSGIAIYAYWELDRHGHRMDFNKNDYETLRQWRNWTKQDYNSVIGDFTKDMDFDTQADDRSYRIKYPYPKGSVLNNRGYADRDYLTKDIDGNKRGMAGTLYDIGACEFNGAVFLQDMEIKTVSEPSTYQSGTGMFNDAEYVMTYLPIDCKVVIRNSGSLDQSAVDVTLIVYRENASGIFEDDKALDTFNIYVDVVTAQSIEASFNLAEAEEGKHDSDRIFLTYAELRKYSDENYVVPEHFDSVMVSNVTPRYKFKIMIRPDENNDNNEMEVVTRYYIRKSEELNMLISAENSWYNIRTTHDGQNPTVDQIAGRLNFEKIADGFGDNGKGLGYYVTAIDKDILHDDEEIQDSVKIDAFDRNSWEPRSVDYSMYKYLFWSDGDDKSLSRYQEWNIEDFLKDGRTYNKKNLVIGSQEIVRENVGDIPVVGGKEVPSDEQFVNDILRAEYVSVGLGVMPTPWMGADGTDGQYAEGIAIGRGMKNNKIEYHDTKYGNGFAEDVMPYCGLMAPQNEGPGLVRPAYSYIQDGNRNEIDSILGVATTTLTKNIVVLGVDWRHWENIERVLRATIDFYESNNGVLIPVELSSFTAEAVSNRVEINWVTASEINTDKFVVERAELNGEFSMISDMPAAGKSYEKKYYGPVVDMNVEYGQAYKYRLKTVDADGSISYSDERIVEIGKNDNLWLGQAAPNPASSDVTFELINAGDSDINVVIYDINGNKVNTDYTITSSGIVFNLNTMSNGQYTLILNIDGNIMTRKFQVVK